MVVSNKTRTQFLSMRKRYCVLVRIELSFYVTHDGSKTVTVAPQRVLVFLA
ncbi:hypothetical protein Plhal703r1_c06g0031081 [Plasmopara halstedii]